MTFAATGTANINLKDYVTANQYLARIDHSFNQDKDKLSFRLITERQTDQGGTNSATATPGNAMRGERGFSDGTFSNFNVNLYLPNADLSLPTFGKSTQAFEPRTIQASAKFIF